MFKCTECDKIYDVKPDYCDDCGNDTFEEITEKVAKNTTPEIKNENKEPEIFPEKPKTEFKKMENKVKKDIDYLSWGFLAGCILLSFFIIFFAWNPKDEAENQDKKINNEQKTAVNIPSNVNGFWNNELPKAEIKRPAEKPIVQQPQILPQKQEAETKIITIPKEIKKTPVMPKPSAQTVQPAQKPVVQPVQKPKIATQQTVQKQAQNQTKPNQTTTKPQTQQKPAQQSQPKPIQQPTSTQPVWQAVQQQNTQQQTQPQQTVNNAALKQELANYKIGLRNAIGKKIDFANVIGDGSCTISFKIAPGGKIINRAFSKQSTNTTLNDAVYAAVMATPSYNPPPSGYKDETLYLKISFYNGNFQITLN